MNPHRSPTDAETHTDLEFITFKIPFYRWSGSIYAMWFEPELTPPQERSPHDKAFEILELMHKNNWKRSEVANHLGLSRARITQMLNVLKIAQENIDKLKQRGVKITERRLRDLER